MKVKKVNRYYCEFCKKSGCSAYWMRKHEERCTLNPNRFCGYCHLCGDEQPKMETLLACLPTPKEITIYGECGEYMSGDALNEFMPKLRKAANNCPACIMAALRQKGIPVPLAKDFDFKKECQDIWSDFNNANAGREY